MNKKEVLKKLSIREKVKWTSGNDMWTIIGNEDLSIKPILVADGPHGVRVYSHNETNLALESENLGTSTMFPVAAAMSSTFNPELIYQVGKAIGEECNHFNVDVLLGPGINLKRSPLGGRNFEYYSEDPYLTTEIASSFVDGVQSTKVGACIKHFVTNEQESQRRFINTVVDERTLHELYLYPFQKVIERSNPYMIMGSYNKVNGHYACESKELLHDILRVKWDYKGAIVSDWGGAQDKVKSIKNGLNIEMPGDSEFNSEMFSAIKNNELSEEEIDQSLLPILDLYEKISQNDNKGKKCDFNSHHEIAKKVSSEAIVLLENDGILPLKKGIKIGVIGDFAKSPRINGGGSATLKPVVLEIPLDELNNVFDVAFAQGYIDDDTNDELLHEVEEVCKNNDTIIFFTGTTSSLEEEGKERPHMNIPKTHLEIFDVIASYSKNVIVILNNGSALNVTPLLAKSNAIIEAWLLGEANAKSLVEIISGDVNPSGRLSETFPIKIEHTPFYGQFPSWTDEVNYNHDIINLGYRYYDTHDYPVRYPFGYGLSYSRFEYQSIEVDKKHLKNDEKVTVLVTLKNVSDMAGYEVVQLYINDVESYYMRPKKELKAFKKVFIAPFETVEVEFILDQSAFSVYAIDYHDFIVESGIFNIMVGSNVNDIFLQDSIEFDSNDPIRFTFTINHPLKTFFKFKPENVEYLVEKYRYFPWYEIEEPAIRVLKRIKNQYNLSEDEFDKIITKLLS